MNNEKTTNELQKENKEELLPKKAWTTPELFNLDTNEETRNGSGTPADLIGPS